MKHHVQTKSYLQSFSVIPSQSLPTPRPGFKLMQLEGVGEVGGALSWRRRRKHEEEEAKGHAQASFHTDCGWAATLSNLEPWGSSSGIVSQGWGRIER